jgi:hypothetical protein
MQAQSARTHLRLGESVTDKEVRFHFIKSHDCKDFGVDGAFGGLSAPGKIVAAFYTERPPIPKETVHDILEVQTEGSPLAAIGPEKLDKRDSRDGFIRVVQSVAYFDLRSAESFHEWLGKMIEEAKKVGI